jgi:Cu(I)/Ag(I) efflux system membrane protein CusA/SilA
MLSSATGSDVTHRIAAPMLGGMATVLILNLLVLPVIYSLVLELQERRKLRVVHHHGPS